MGMCAKHRNAVFATGQHVGSARRASNIACASHRHTTIGPLRATQAKLCHRTALSSRNYARRLCGHQRLKANGVKQRRLKQLALKRRTHDTHHGLTRKHQLALRYSIDINMRTKAAQVLQKCRVKHAATSRSRKTRQIVDILVGKTQVFYQLRQIRRATHYCIGTAKRFVAVEGCKTALLLQLAVFP